jgi:hypothetical protein
MSRMCPFISPIRAEILNKAYALKIVSTKMMKTIPSILLAP